MSKIPNKTSKQEKKPTARLFKACGIKINGGFDPQGYLPNGNPDGSTCVGGMRTWWSHTDATSDTLERVAGRCKCLRTFVESNRQVAAGEQLPFVDGKSKASL